MRRIIYSVMLLVLSGGLIACRQGLNDRCQVNSDCEDGLLCVYPPGGTPQTGGTCQMPSSSTDMAGVDQATSDAAADAAGTDAAADASSTDAGVAGDGGDLAGADGASTDMTGDM